MRKSLINYFSVSLFPICGKIFGKGFCNKMFRVFSGKKIITPHQFGFKPDDSCINQLLSIIHEILKSFDDGVEVRSVFLDICKAFDNVWHDGIIFKLEQNGISGKLLNILIDFLSNRQQRVVLNAQVSARASINAGVQQGSILGPLLFLICFKRRVSIIL